MDNGCTLHAARHQEGVCVVDVAWHSRPGLVLRRNGRVGGAGHGAGDCASDEPRGGGRGLDGTAAYL